MIDWLAHCLGWTIAIAAAGDAKRAQTLLTGVETRLYDEVTGMSPAGKAIRQ